MYKLIFYTIYKLLTQAKAKEAEDSAVTVLIVAIFFHLFFLATMFDLLEHNPIRNAMINFAGGEVPGKYFWTPFVILFMYLIYKRYNSDRRKKIIETYENKNYTIGWFHALFILIIIFTPLIIV